MQKKAQRHLLADKFKVLVIILLGSLSWSLTMVKSGVEYSYGMGFWGPNGRDGIWHIAVAKTLSQFSLETPIFAGSNLQNYHLGFDFVMALIHKVTGLSLFTLYYQILPIILSFAIGILCFKFVIKLTNSYQKSWWACFFVYFGGSMGWILTLVRGQGIGGESLFWSQQAVSTLLNPPFALSLVFILSTLIFIQNKKTLYAVVVGSLILQTKVYGGALFLGGLLVAAVYEYIKAKNIYLFKIWVGMVTLSLLFFLPINYSSSQLLIFQPFWFLETMMRYTDRVGWARYFEAMTNYRLANDYIKGFLSYFFAFVIFIVGNFATRIVGIRNIIHYKKATWVEVLMIIIVLGGLLSTLLFVQKGTAWNIIQFLYYSLFFMGIFCGIAVGGYIQKIKSQNTKKLIAFSIVALTIPTTISTLFFSYLPSRPPAKVSWEELEALRFLEIQPKGIVLTYPFDEYKAKEAITNPPRPLYRYDYTAYVSAFSGKVSFLDDETNASIIGLDAKGRRDKILQFLATLDQKKAYSFLRENNISYIYWIKGQRAALVESQLGITKIFENMEVDIYRVE